MMDQKTPAGDASTDPSGPQAGDARPAASRSLVRVQKRIVVETNEEVALDGFTVASAFYNSFNVAMLQSGGGGRIAIGVTSPRSGDGTSLVAANLATFLALSHDGDTVLVDMNVRKPVVHSIFGVQQAPGMLESLFDPEIHVQKTTINHLFVLPVGRRGIRGMMDMQRSPAGGAASNPLSNLDLLTDFRNLLYSLKESFDVVIFDLPPIEESEAPTVFTKQLDGVVVVVRSGETRQEDLDRVLFQMTEDKVLGFVFNRFDIRTF